MKNTDLLQHIKTNVKDLSKQSAFSDISNLLSTISNAGFFTPNFKRQIKASEAEVDPAPETVKPEDGNVWELKTYTNGMEFINMKDTTFNMSITFEEDDDFKDPEHILDDLTLEELELIEEEEEKVEDIISKMAALSTLGQATAQLSIPGLAGQFPDKPVPLCTNTIKIHPAANEALKIYLASTPVPDKPIPNTWTMSKGLPTSSEQTRIAQQYIAAMSSSPVAMVTSSCMTGLTGTGTSRIGTSLTGQVKGTRPGWRGVTPVTASGTGQVRRLGTGERGVEPLTASGRGQVSTGGRGGATGGRGQVSSPKGDWRGEPVFTQPRWR